MRQTHRWIAVFAAAALAALLPGSLRAAPRDGAVALAAGGREKAAPAVEAGEQEHRHEPAPPGSTAPS